MEPRYERNASALSERESVSLSGKKICVIGCGGLGGFVIEMAARIGVGHIVAVDFDRFSESNLNRQLLSTEKNLGAQKAEAAKRRVADINSSTIVTAITDAFSEKNAQAILAGSDVAIDALDNVPTRLLLQQFCTEMRIPLVHGAVAGWYGEVTTILPGDSGFDILYGGHSGKGAGHVLGNLPCTVAATASAQCAEMVKLLIGRGDLLSKKLFRLDLLRNDFSTIPFS